MTTKEKRKEKAEVLKRVRFARTLLKAQDYANRWFRDKYTQYLKDLEEREI